MKRSVRLIALIFIIILGIENVQSGEKNSVGWDKTRLGMTAGELKELYPEHIEEVPLKENEPDNTYSNLEIKGIEMFGEPFDAVLWMDTDSDMLVSVVSSPAAKGGNYVQEKLFSDIVDKLTKMYGKPSSLTTRKGFGSANWYLGKTQIELAYLSTDEYNEHLFLIYKKT